MATDVDDPSSLNSPVCVTVIVLTVGEVTSTGDEADPEHVMEQRAVSDAFSHAS